MSHFQNDVALLTKPEAPEAFEAAVAVHPSAILILTLIARSSLVAALMCAAAFAQQPRIDSVLPSQGPIAGGTIVILSGASFTSAAVKLDGTLVTPLAQSDTQIHLQMPPHDNGYALIQVGSAAAEFLYIPPKLTDLPPGYITTVAGVGIYTRFHLPASASNLEVSTVTAGMAGNLYAASAGQHRVVQIRADGIVEPFAGTGTLIGQTGDGGPATKASITFPRVCSLDAAGNVFIPDESNRVRRVDAGTGIITTIAGTGEAGFSGDGGLGTAAKIDHPNYLVAARDGTVYFLDFGNSRIRKVSPGGTISTVAGTGVSGHSGDEGPATSAQIETIAFEYDSDGLALDARGDGLLYLAESYSGRIRRIDLGSGIITSFLPRPGQPPLDLARPPTPLVVDESGNVFVGMKGKIVKYGADGNRLGSWGDGTINFSEDGTPIDRMHLVLPAGLALDSAGNLLFTDQAVSRIRRINLQSGLLETVAGIGPNLFGVPGPAVGAVLSGEVGDLMFLPSGDLLLTDGHLWIFKIDPTGRISTFGGTGFNGFGESPGDGRSISNVVTGPGAMASDGLGGFYMCGEYPVDYVDPNGLTYHIAGASDRGYAGDGGPAAQALLTQPWDVVVDREGNIFIADTNNNRIRRVDHKSGIITTVAGGGPLNGFEGYGHGSFCGDGGPALNACFNTPFSLGVDPFGNIFVSDFFNARLRKVDAGGIITTWGNGMFGKILTDAYGGLFVQEGNRVWRFLPDGSSWAIAGTGESGFSGDGGPATEARLWSSSTTPSIDADSEGNLFFHDVTNHRIRAVRFGTVLAPPNATIQVTANGSTIRATVFTSSGIPAPGVRVDFTVPSVGASCTLSNPFAITDADGVGGVSCTPNCIAGPYSLIARPLTAVSSATVSLTNVGRPCRRRAVRH